jgi:Zn-dependent protease with chaperone function
MHKYLVLLMGFAIYSATVTPASGGPITADEIKAEKQRLQSHIWVLRPVVNTSVTAYVHTDSGMAYYTRERTRLFPLRVIDSVFVKDLSGDSRKIKMELLSTRLGKGRVTIYPPLGKRLELPMLHILIHDILEDPSAPEVLAPVLGNRTSRMAHCRGANHLPTRGFIEEFKTVEAATSKGYRPCPICFRPTPTVPNYVVEKNLGDACAAQFRQFNPVVPDDKMNERIRLAGENVLSQWVVPLRGYEYRFQVVENDQPNAVACPGGAIFVTTGLLNALETEDELEAVLAHEIAHVERRHGYRQYKRAQTANVIGGILGAVAGVAVAAKTEDMGKATTVAQAVQIVSGVGAGIAISGYGRREEEEADSYALAFADRVPEKRGAAAMANVLAKLKYSDSVNGIYGSGLGLFMTHPQIDDRLSKAGSGRVRSFDGLSFGGYDKQGHLLLTVTLEHQAFFDYLDQPEPGESYDPNAMGETSNEPARIRELQVFASVRSTTDLGTSVEIDGLSIFSGSKEYKLDNKEDTEVPPGEVVGMNFVAKKAGGLLAEEIAGLKINVYGVERWQRLPLGTGSDQSFR